MPIPNHKLGCICARCEELRENAASEREREALCPSDATTCSSVGGDFYKGIEWLACWLLDNCEGEEITEEQLRPWAQKAWLAHLDRKNA
jgi:hypothetical protein